MQAFGDRGGRQLRILGLNFYAGDADGAIRRISNGGLLVVPAAPALKDLVSNSSYREALIGADVAITDSAFMVLIWNLLHLTWIRRLSGLEYLRELLRRPDVREPENIFWVMAGKRSAKINLEWLRSEGITVPEGRAYNAPVYGEDIVDLELLEQLNRSRPKHIVLTVGGGTQERLGLYLKQNLSYLPAIHCIGAAIAFLSGDQVRIPIWADRLYLGWLLRCLSSPGRYVPRYWSAFQLFPLMLRYRDKLPPLRCVQIK
jgi:N-acetylglucosaminyldiphosphoundecaprenol N-acetyl-beta-D-mannosaminyltransferase